jgi:hypothetical protein
MGSGEWANPVAIATLVLAAVTFCLVIAAFRSIRENRRMRSEDRDLDSKKRRLAEVKHWINQVLILKSESAGVPGTVADRRQRATQARIIVSNKEYVMIEAERLDSEFKPQAKLKDQIDKLSHILEHTHPEELGSKQGELENLCIEALKVISNIKAELKL